MPDEDDRLHIERKLDGSGRLARGDHTRMHTLNFSMRTVPRPHEKLAPEHHPAGAAPVEAATIPPVPVPGDDTAPVDSPPGAIRRLMDWITRRPPQ